MANPNQKNKPGGCGCCGCSNASVCVLELACVGGVSFSGTVDWTGPSGFTSTCSIINGRCCISPTAGEGTYVASALDSNGILRSVSIVVGDGCFYSGILCLGGAGILTIVKECTGALALGETVTIVGSGITGSETCITSSNAAQFPLGECFLCVPDAPGTYTVSSGTGVLASVTVNTTMPCTSQTVTLCRGGWGTLEGTVSNLCSPRQPMVGATVTFQGGTATTDSSGFFSICYPNAPTTPVTGISCNGVSVGAGAFTATVTVVPADPRYDSVALDLCSTDYLSTAVYKCSTTQIGILLPTASGYTFCGEFPPNNCDTVDDVLNNLAQCSFCLCQQSVGGFLCGPMSTGTMTLTSSIFGTVTLSYNPSTCTWDGETTYSVASCPNFPIFCPDAITANILFSAFCSGTDSYGNALWEVTASTYFQLFQCLQQIPPFAPGQVFAHWCVCSPDAQPSPPPPPGTFATCSYTGAELHQFMGGPASVFSCPPTFSAFGSLLPAFQVYYPKAVFCNTAPSDPFTLTQP